MATNTVEIKVAAVTKEAERGFQNVNRQMKNTEQQAARTSQPVGSLNKGFAGIGKNLIGFAAGAFSVTVVLREVIKGMENVTKTAGFSDVVLSGFGQEFQAQMVTVLDQFKQLQAASVGKISLVGQFTETEAKAAFAVITRESRTANVSIDALKASMGLAKITGMDLAGAAKIIGQAFLGNVGPVRELVGEVESIDQLFTRLIKGGETAATAIGEIGAAAKEGTEDVGSMLDKLLKGDLKGFWEEFWVAALDVGGFVKAIKNFTGALTIALGEVLVEAFGKGFKVAIDFVINNLPGVQAAKDVVMWLWDHRDFDVAPTFKTLLGPVWDFTVDAAKWLWGHKGFDFQPKFKPTFPIWLKSPKVIRSFFLIRCLFLHRWPSRWL